MLCESPQKQQEVLDYMKSIYGMNGFTITIPASCE